MAETSGTSGNSGTSGTPDTNQSLRARREAATPRGVATAAPFFVERAENAELWDAEGRRYLDFAGGIAVLNTGHRHPRVLAALAAQLERLRTRRIRWRRTSRTCGWRSG